MNLRKTCPDIPDTWKGGITEVAKLLGEEKPISQTTVIKYTQLGCSFGLFSISKGLNGRVQYTGVAVKTLWNLM